MRGHDELSPSVMPAHAGIHDFVATNRSIFLTTCARSGTMTSGSPRSLTSEYVLSEIVPEGAKGGLYREKACVARSAVAVTLLQLQGDK